jgi:hypothetical protein
MGLETCKAILGLGVVFILLGVVFTLWSKRERNKYYNSIILTKRDVKEFMTHDPERPWLSAWNIGGTISLIIGIILAIAGGVLWLVLY